MNDRDRALWSLAFATFVVGDIATTHVGLFIPGVVEANASVIPFIRIYGVWGMLGAKSLVMSLGYASYRYLPEPVSLGIPIGLSLLGAAVTGWNLYVILLGLG